MPALTPRLMFCFCLVWGVSGCDDGDSGAAGDAGADVSVSDAGFLDAAPDAAAPDAAIECLRPGLEWTGNSTPDPRTPARALSASLDFDADGRADLLASRVDEGGLMVTVHRGVDLSELANVAVPGAVGIDFMPDEYPPQALAVPVEGDPAVWAWFEHRGDGNNGVRVVAADTLTGLRFLTVEGGLSSAQLVHLAPDRSRIFAQTQAGGCALFDPSQDEALGQWDRCRLQPLWDVNGDGVLDLARAAGAGTAILDGVTLDPIAQREGQTRFGFRPATTDAPGGPLSLRGVAEVAGIVVDGGRAELHFMDPQSFASNGDPQLLTTNEAQFDFAPTEDGLSIVAVETRGGLLFLTLTEVGERNRQRGEWGPHTNFTWGQGPDLNGDGQPDAWLRGGPRANFTESDLIFFDLSNGEELWELDGQSSAIFEPIWWQHQFTDVDGCDGVERVVLRRGAENAEGVSGTRVLVYDDTGREIWRGEPVSTLGHQIVLADLDGDGDAELLELIDTGDGGQWVARAR